MRSVEVASLEIETVNKHRNESTCLLDPTNHREIEHFDDGYEDGVSSALGYRHVLVFDACGLILRCNLESPS